MGALVKAERACGHRLKAYAAMRHLGRSSFRGVPISAFTRVFDALWARIRNDETKRNGRHKAGHDRIGAEFDSYFSAATTGPRPISLARPCAVCIWCSSKVLTSGRAAATSRWTVALLSAICTTRLLTRRT